MRGAEVCCGLLKEGYAAPVLSGHLGILQPNCTCFGSRAFSFMRLALEPLTAAAPKSRTHGIRSDGRRLRRWNLRSEPQAHHLILMARS